MSELHTRTLTLVVQRVCDGDEIFNRQVAFALLEYAADVLNGEGGNGQFERHVTLNRCRIEAIASVAPIPGDEAREGLVSGTGTAALRDRLQTAIGISDYLIGADKAGEVATHLGYTPEDAARDLKAKLTEALEALGATPGEAE